MDDIRARFDGLVGGAFEVSRQERESRWLAQSDEHVAFAADDDASWRRLQSEGWLTGRWRSGSIPAPCVIGEDPERRIQVRERLHGLTGHALASRVWPGAWPDAATTFDDVPLAAFGERLAASYGELARRIKAAVSVADATAAGIGTTSRREIDINTGIARLQASSASRAAKQAAERLRTWLTTLPPPDAVIHADLHLWNICCADDGSIVGVFDLGDAGIDAAAQELSLAHSLSSRFGAIAIDAYGPVDLEHVRRAHLRSALEHMIDHPPGTERHESIVAWATAAFERLAP